MLLAVFGCCSAVLRNMAAPGVDSSLGTQAWYEEVSYEGTAPGKFARLEALDPATSKEPIPPSYLENSFKEELVLEYIADFSAQFAALFPHRRQPWLVARNEAGVPKWIGGCIVPTRLPWADGDKLSDITSHISQLLRYEPLPDPLAPPEYLPSPGSTVKFESADSFDAAVLMTSALIGAGYAAYAVWGTAPRWVTLKDMRRLDLAGPEPGAAELAASASAENEAFDVAASSAKTSSTSAAGKGRGRSEQDKRGSGSRQPAKVDPASGTLGRYHLQGKAPPKSKYLALMERRTAEAEAEAALEAAFDSDEDAAVEEAREVGRHVQRIGAERERQGVPMPDDRGTVAALVRKPGAGGAGAAAAVASTPDEAAVPVPGSQYIEGDGHAPAGALKLRPRRGAVPEASPDADAGLDTDDRDGERVHAWVLLLPGKRGVVEPAFVEPSTGQVYPIASAPYYEVECVWNHRNAWVNMQDRPLLPPAPKTLRVDVRSTADIAADARALFKRKREDAAAAAAALEEAGEPAEGKQDEGFKVDVGVALPPGVSAKPLPQRPKKPVLGTAPPAFGDAAGVSTEPLPDLAAEVARLGLGGEEASGAPAAAAPAAGSADVAQGSPTAGPEPSEGKAGEAEDHVVAAPAHARHACRTQAYDLADAAAWEYLFVPTTGPKAAKKNDLVALDAEEKTADEDTPHMAKGDHVLDAPPAWAAPPTISRPVWRQRYGAVGRLVQQGHRVRRELLAPLSNSTGLQERVTWYADQWCAVASRVVEKFSHRRDCLLLRDRDMLAGTTSEYFAPGRTTGLKCITERLGVSRTFEYYVDARLDGLRRRHEEFGKKITYEFEGAIRGLQYRSATLGKWVGPAPEPGSDASEGKTASDELGNAGSELAASMGVTARAKAGDAARTLATSAGVFTLVKMAEKYQRHPARPAYEDIAKMSYLLNENAIQVRYHTSEGRLIPCTRRYHKDRADGAMEFVTEDPDAPELSEFAVELDFKDSLSQEMECFSALRSAQKAAMAVMAQRRWDEDNLELDKSVFEIAEERAESGVPLLKSDTDAGEQVAEGSADYLAPFLHDVRDPSNMTAEEAAAVRRAARNALAERHRERARIIQSRLDSENEALQRKQREFARNRDQVEGAEEEFEAFCTEAMFRIGILEKRLARQDSVFAAKMAALEDTLQADLRLSILYTEPAANLTMPASRRR